MENSQTSHLKEIIKRTKKPICTFSLWIHAYKHTPNTLNCSYSSFKYQHFYEDFSDTYLQIIFPFTVLDSILSLYYTSYHNLKLMKYLFLALVFESASFKFITSISGLPVLKKYNEKYVFIWVCIYISSVQSLSCVQLCDPIDCRMPVFPVHF